MDSCKNITSEMVCKISGVEMTGRDDACEFCQKIGIPEPGNHNSVTASLRYPHASENEREELSVYLRRKPPPEPRPGYGPGTELKKLLAKIGLDAKPDCPCNARARDMDRKGADWCEDNIETIVGWLREEAQRRELPFFDLPARMIVRRAIKLARKNEPPRDERHPLARHVTRWAVGITSAPRKSPTLVRCVQSVKNAGFDPVVFAEPGTDTSGVSCEVVTRSERLGCWRNYVQTMRDLLSKFPDAQAIAIIQDDVVMACETREFLERDLWPSAIAGVVSLYCPDHAGYETDGHFGLKRIDMKRLIGACAMVYPRHVAEKMVKHKMAEDWAGAIGRTEPDPVKKKAADAWAGMLISKLRLKSYFYDPSLVQHIATHSAVGHGGREQTRGGRKYRQSGRFQGEAASPFRVFHNAMPTVRFNLPDGSQRFPRWTQPENPDPVSVVIPAVDCEELTKRCLDSVADHAGHPVRVVYVDNGSKPGVADRVEQHARQSGLEIQVIRNEANLGFTKATNQGIRLSAGHHVLLLNNDARLTPGCLPNLVRELETHSRVAACGPLSDDRGHQSIRHQRRAKWRDRRHINLETMLTGFCCLKHRDALQDVGMLDESPEFAGGLGTDDDWCNRATKRGWKLFLVHDAFAHHDHSSTFKELGMDRKGMQQRAMAELKRKSKGLLRTATRDELKQELKATQAARHVSSEPPAPAPERGYLKRFLSKNETKPVELITPGPFHFSVGDIATANATAAQLSQRGIPTIQTAHPTGERVCVIGGGYVLRETESDWGQLLRFHRTPGQNILNAAGVVADADGGDWSHLNEYKYRSVRDELSRQRLRAGGVDADIRLSPCPAMKIDPLPMEMLAYLPNHLWVCELLEQSPVLVQETLSLNWLNGILSGPVLAVNPTPWDARGVPWSFPTAPITHSPEVMAALAAHSRGVITRSLHLAIFALAAETPFLVPHYGEGDQAGEKIKRYLERAGLPEAIVDRQDIDSQNRINFRFSVVRKKIGPVSQLETERTECHLNAMADAIKANPSKKAGGCGCENNS